MKIDIKFCGRSRGRVGVKIVIDFRDLRVRRDSDGVGNEDEWGEKVGSEEEKDY